MTAKMVLHKLLSSCLYLHRRGIVHRDLKPEEYIDAVEMVV
jgi:serine/threonine protein kinase